MSPVSVPDLADVAERVLGQKMSELALTSRELPECVRDAANDYRAAVSDVVSAGRQLRADLDELNSKKNLVPPEGFRELRQAALDDARNRASRADRDAERALATIKAELVKAAQPQLDPRREQLARDEATLALGASTGDRAGLAVMEIAERGSPDAQAAIVSPWGAVLLRARGVTDPEPTLERARTVIAGKASERGGTPRELIAGAAAFRLGGLAAARGAAGSYVLNVAAGRA